MRRVTGLGGVFFKCKDRDELTAWYRDHLGLDVEPGGPWVFEWREKDDPETIGHTVWGTFKGDTSYFDPSDKPFMINYRVDNLARVLAELRAEGVQVDDKTEESEYGKFGWIMDPEGNRVELWEPPGASD